MSAAPAALAGHRKKKKKRSEELGDFTTTVRVIPISLLAIVIGFIAALVAWSLLRLIGFFTNLFYFGRVDFAMTSPALNHLGIYAIAVPVLGSIIVGLMARYGSDRIRGHGIPEAIESILMNGSRVPPRLAILKPISAAIAIGSGGPFGAEGPIIMTGGAFGSLIAQFFHLTSAERKTLLVAGAAAGMSAVFATPVAAVLLAVELLLFEWKPRSVLPVALASATAGAARRYILGMGPLFPTAAHPAFIGPEGLLGCALVGIMAGALSAILTLGVYAAEDAFHKLPVHWMWWPAIGAVVVGIGGLIFPRALGVGYDNIALLLRQPVTIEFMVGLLVVKSIIWIVALGSGTSGGVVAPILMIGASLGGLEALFLPHFGTGFWPLVSMGATMAGVMACPFTGVVFAVELTHDFNMMMPLLISCFLSYFLIVLTMKRSILTEKISRRGYHLSREYAIDPLEILFTREVMRPNVVALPSEVTLDEAREMIRPGEKPRGQHLFPVVDEEKHLVGIVSRNHLMKAYEEAQSAASQIKLHEIASPNPVVAFANEPLRVVVYRMIETGFTRFPVMDPQDEKRLLGMVALDDLLRARSRSLEEERARERVLRLRMPMRQRRSKDERKITVTEESDLRV
jgi:CIC family chloride channel protein